MKTISRASSLLAAGAVALAPAVFAPAVAHAQSASLFHGPYAGAEIGWEDNRGALGNGFNYGIFGGYNAEVAPQIIAGVEARASLSTAEGDLGPDAELRAGRSLGIAGRVGYLAAPTTLFFGKVGYENVRTRLEYNPDPLGLDNGYNNDALVLGGGVEYAVMPSATLRVGYDYTNGENGYRRHQIKTGMAIHF